MYAVIASANTLGLPLPYDWDPDARELWTVIGWMEKANEDIEDEKNPQGDATNVKRSEVPVDIEAQMIRMGLVKNSARKSINGQR